MIHSPENIGLNISTIITLYRLADASLVFYIAIFPRATHQPNLAARNFPLQAFPLPHYSRHASSSSHQRQSEYGFPCCQTLSCIPVSSATPLPPLPAISRVSYGRSHAVSANTPSTGCEEVMALLDECHARGFIHSVFGNCNQAKRDVNRCLRAARLERTALNREKSRERSEKMRALWKEIDENS